MKSTKIQTKIKQNKTKYFKALALILLVIIYPLTARGLFYFVEPFYKNLF